MQNYVIINLSTILIKCFSADSQTHAEPLPVLDSTDVPIAFGGVTERIAATAEQLLDYPIENLVSHAQDIFHVIQRPMNKVPRTSKFYAAIKEALSKALDVAKPAGKKLEDLLLAQTPAELLKKANPLAAEVRSALLSVAHRFSKEDLEMTTQQDQDNDIQTLRHALKSCNEQHRSLFPSNLLTPDQALPSQGTGQALLFDEAEHSSMVEHGVVCFNT